MNLNNAHLNVHKRASAVLHTYSEPKHEKIQPEMNCHEFAVLTQRQVVRDAFESRHLLCNVNSNVNTNVKQISCQYTCLYIKCLYSHVHRLGK